MPRPTESVEWATELETQYYTSQIDGGTVLTFNKLEPDVAFKLRGIPLRGPFYRPFINYILYALGKHVTYLRQGEVNDIHYTADTSLTSADIQGRKGGTWEDLGTDTLAGTSVRVFRKTA
jgi:hypothetical protein